MGRWAAGAPAARPAGARRRCTAAGCSAGRVARDGELRRGRWWACTQATSERRGSMAERSARCRGTGLAPSRLAWTAGTASWSRSRPGVVAADVVPVRTARPARAASRRRLRAGRLPGSIWQDAHGDSRRRWFRHLQPHKRVRRQPERLAGKCCWYW